MSSTRSHTTTTSATSRGVALRLEDLRKRYPGRPPVDAVDGIDLEVPRGQMFGLLGPNGAGKSTTVGICTTRRRPTGGRAEVLGVDVVAEPARAKRRLGVVTQANTLDRSLTLEENLTFHGRYFGVPRQQARRRARELLQRFRLADRAEAFPGQISGGMAQRLQIARAVAHRPEVLFLDEPTAGLDPQSRLALWELVQELRADGMTVVLTTHHMDEADALCDRVAIVDHGRVLVCDTPARLKADHGAGAIVDLALAGTAPAVPRARLEQLPGVTEVEDRPSGLRVRASSSEGLVAALAGVLGSDLREVTVTDTNLESVFINLTGRDLRE